MELVTYFSGVGLGCLSVMVLHQRMTLVNESSTLTQKIAGMRFAKIRDSI